MTGIRATLVAVVGMLASLVLAPPAAAEHGGLHLSTDGDHWSSSLSEPLFDGLMLVPAGEAVRSFYVRNSHPSPGSIVIALVNTSRPDSPLARHLTVSASTPGTAGTAAPLDHTGGCAGVLVSDQEMEPGEEKRVDVVVAFADVDDRTAQAATASFQLRLTLAASRSEATTVPTCSDDPGPPGTAGPPPAPCGDGWTRVVAGLGDPRPSPCEPTADLPEEEGVAGTLPEAGAADGLGILLGVGVGLVVAGGLLVRRRNGYRRRRTIDL